MAARTYLPIEKIIALNKYLDGILIRHDDGTVEYPEGMREASSIAKIAEAIDFPPLTYSMVQITRKRLFGEIYRKPQPPKKTTTRSKTSVDMDLLAELEKRVARLEDQNNDAIEKLRAEVHLLIRAMGHFTDPGKLGAYLREHFVAAFPTREK